MTDDFSLATAERDIGALREGAAPVRDRLNTTLFLTAAVHLLVLLGVTFSRAAPDGPGAPGLDVVLLPSAIDDNRPNRDARYLSQANQQGSGLDRPAESVESGLPALDGSTGATKTGGEQAVTPPRQRRAPAVLVADGGDTIRNVGLPTGTPPTATAGLAGTAPLWNTTVGQNPRLGGPKRELAVRADTRESGLAVYLDRWRHHVEDVGTTHYPLGAIRRGRLSGNPVLEVQLLADGTLGEVLLQRSSGVPELDRAALGILRLAAPFEAFSSELRANHDAIRLSYEWEFSSGRLHDTNVH
jgi:protein TonB